MEFQTVLTVAFNFVCIGYSTLVAANFVCGLVEVWIGKGDESSVEPTDTVVSELVVEVAEPVSEQQVVVEEPQPEPEMVMEVEASQPQPDVVVEVETVRQVAPDGKEVELAALSIRELKAMCKGGRVKKYSSMTKAQLVEALLAA
jgi:hypothetical protein